jgi:peptidoglycan hydrolase CwlO-like protein
MNLHLAQLVLESTPALITFLVGGSAALFLVNQALTFYKDHIKETPTPAGTYATLEKLDVELGRERGARKQMHQEMTEIQKSITALQTETDSQSNDIGSIKDDIKNFNDRIDAIPQRVITLLRETKGLI